MTSTFRRPAAPLLLALLLAFTGTGCDSSEPEPGTEPGTIVAGVSLTRLFAPATTAEISQVEADWEARSPEASGAEVVASGAFGGATVYVVSHTMASGPGAPLTHYGLVRVPDGIEDDAPVLVVHHGGDNGFSIATNGGATSSNTSVEAMAQVFPSLFSQTVQVIPTYRAETMVAGVAGLDADYASGGSASPWDYDVDDSIALLSAALDLFDDETDEESIGALGYSRGANVALLHQIRDDRIDAVTEYYGPTDFYNSVIQSLALGVLLGDTGALSLPGALYLRDEVLTPLQGAGGVYNPDADYATARLEIVRRSASLFKEDLENLQIHHHENDGVVSYPVSVAFDAQPGTVGGDYEFNTYNNPVDPFLAHSPEGMPSSQVPTEQWLADYLGFEVGPSVLEPALAE